MTKTMAMAILAGVVMAASGLALAEETGGAVVKDAGKGAVEGVAAGETAAAPKKAEPPTVAPIVSPDASNAVDSDDLVKRLTGDEKDEGAGAEKKFKDIIDRMGDASKRLKGVDAGEVTQEVERRIVLDLDVLIEMAKKSQSSSKGKPDKSKDKPQQAQMSESQKTQGKSSMGGTEAATNSEMRNGDATAAPGADIHEKGAEGWGNLPETDRRLLTQLKQENFLPSYRAAIERYYEELARLNRSK